MKSGLLNIVTAFKDKNIKLRNEVENDYKRYTYLMNQPSLFKIILTDNSIVIEDNGEVTNYNRMNTDMLRNVLHTYLSRSILTGKNAYRYDVFVFDDVNSKICEKYGYFEQMDKTTDRRAVVVCSSKKVLSFLRKELVSNYRYIVINDRIERMLEL